MPRKDGDQTVREMLSEFNQIGSEVFVRSYTAFVGAGKISNPAYNGKRFSDLLLDFSINYNDSDHALESESFQVRTVNDYDVEAANFHPLYGYDRDLEHVDKIKTGRMAVADCIIGQPLEFSLARQPEAFVSDWKATFRGTIRTRHVSSDKERPTRASTISGISMGKKVLALVQKPYFPDNFKQQNDQDRTEIGPNFITSRLLVPYYQGISLNGYEPKKYLAYAVKECTTTLTSLTSRLTRLQELKAPKIYLEHQERRIAATSESLRHAEDALRINEMLSDEQ